MAATIHTTPHTSKISICIIESISFKETKYICEKIECI